MPVSIVLLFKGWLEWRIHLFSVGTPRNPLNENNPPKECAYFGKNYNIQNQESALNEEMEIVEL